MKKIRCIVISLVALIALSSVSSIIRNSYNFEDEKNVGTKNISQSNVTIPILIDEEDPTRNWSYTVVTYDWCTGNGKLNDPYVIENITINGENSGSCIEIRNSNVYFNIDGCTLFNSSLGSNPNYNAGIKLVNATNGRIINNNCSDNVGCGISLNQNSNNNSILKNIVNDNDYGILVVECNNNVIWGNVVRRNYNIGIHIYNSNENEISGNVASEGSGSGIFLDLSHNNTIFNNKAHSNGVGLYLYSSDSNFVDRNVFTYQSLGVAIFNGHNNILVNNQVCYNTWNFKTLSGTGNFWNNSGCIQIEHSITINYPLQDEIFNETAPDFNVEISAPNLDEIWYTLNLTDEKFLFTANGTFDQTAWSLLSDGNVTIRFYASDIVDNIDFEQVIVKKETPREQIIPNDIYLYIIFGSFGVVSLILIIIFIRKKYRIKI